MKNVKYFTTQDFYNACVLRASNISLKRIFKASHKFVVFIFDANEDTCSAILKQHWDRTLQLESRLLIETINELKSRMYETLYEK